MRLSRAFGKCLMPAIKHHVTYRIERALALAEPDALIEADGRGPKRLLRST